MVGTRNATRVLLAMLATIFVMAFVSQAFAFESGGSTPFTYTGKIVALADNNRIITVQAGPNAEKSFNLLANSEVMRCGMPASLHDLKIGDEVSVNYFDEGDGTLVVNGIDYWASGMRC